MGENILHYGSKIGINCWYHLGMGQNEGLWGPQSSAIYIYINIYIWCIYIYTYIYNSYTLCIIFENPSDCKKLLGPLYFFCTFTCFMLGKKNGERSPSCFDLATMCNQFLSGETSISIVYAMVGWYSGPVWNPSGPFSFLCAGNAHCGAHPGVQSNLNHEFIICGRYFIMYIIDIYIYIYIYYIHTFTVNLN